MSFKTLSRKVTSKIGRQVLITKKHSPALLFGAGLVGVATTVVLGCRATLKLSDVLEKGEQKIEALNNADDVTIQETDKAKMRAKLGIAIDVAKLYAPTVIAGVATVGALTGSHVILSRRNAGLTAAYAAVDKAYKEYRERVIKEFGAEKDFELRHDFETKEIAVETDEGPVPQTVKVVTRSHSPYARVFGQGDTTNWSPIPWENQTFIKVQQQYANDLLHARGHVFLNEVYDMLGFDRTPEGQQVGWVRGNGHDDYIDFNVYTNLNGGTQFVNGDRHTVWLDFNVDGNVLDKI